MKDLRVWWVFACDNYYPSSGNGNLHSTYFTEEEARAVAKLLEDKYDRVDVENISRHLYV